MSPFDRRPASAPGLNSPPTLPTTPEPDFGDNVYRAVTALRSDPQLTSHPLAPDFYLAAADLYARDDERLSESKDPLS